MDDDNPLKKGICKPMKTFGETIKYWFEQFSQILVIDRNQWN